MARAKTDSKRMKARVRQEQALNLRIAGASYEQIKERLGYASRGAAYVAVDAILKRREQEPADELRKIESERLDTAQLGIWQRAVGTKDIPASLEALDRLLRLMARRAALLGLDVPTTTKLEHSGPEGGDIIYRMVWDDGSGDEGAEEE